jgi:alkanesulfonate monooxygenase SsuD/methylene tetrahydromethanopterin reductase-like flavin-dependent oxidoreductase (luciferase family)
MSVVVLSSQHRPVLSGMNVTEVHVQYGYFTMPLHPPGSDLTKTLDEDLEQIIVLDQLGFQEAWIGEHFTAGWENIPAPDLLIAKAIPLTKNIILGIGVSCMPNHNPFVLAHRIAMLDHLAHGRFYWGVGAGSFPGDFKVFGINPKTGEQRVLTHDAIELILKLWEDPEPGLYENKYWRFWIPEPQKDVGLGLHVKPYQKPHPPIAVAGISESSGTLMIAGERDWIPMSINLIAKQILRSHWKAVEEGAQKAGKSADRSKWRVARDVYVAETMEQARREVLEGTLGRDFKEYFFRLVPRIRGSLDIFKIDPTMPDSEVTLEYMLENMWIVGGPDDVAGKIRELYEYLGGFGVLLVMGHEWQPRDQWVRSMTLLAKEVMPRLQDLG